jgi:hypothetical protein
VRHVGEDAGRQPAPALLVLWLLGFLVVPIGSGLIHLLLVIALVVLIYQLVSGRRAI